MKPTSPGTPGTRTGFARRRPPVRLRWQKGDRDRLRLAGGIVLTVVWSRDLPAATSSVRVYQDSVGHWYCSFVVPTQMQPLPKTGRALGVDWGVKQTATTTSHAHDLPHTQHGRKAQARLTRYDRMMARRRPKKGQAASKGCHEAKHLRAKAYKKVARQRQDTGRMGSPLLERSRELGEGRRRS